MLIQNFITVALYKKLLFPSTNISSEL